MIMIKEQEPQGCLLFVFLNRFMRREGRKMREEQEVKELEVEANYDLVKEELRNLLENLHAGEVITIEFQTIGKGEK